jgi:hypothetical protein
VLYDYPAMGKYLAADSRIVKCPSFESAVAKIVGGNEENLSEFEKSAVRHLLKPIVVIESAQATQTSSYANKLLIRQAIVHKMASSNSSYINLRFIAPTSVLVESFFSVAGFVLGERRMGILPHHIEEQLFLKVNYPLWNVRMLVEFYTKDTCLISNEIAGDDEVIEIEDDCESVVFLEREVIEIDDDEEEGYDDQI